MCCVLCLELCVELGGKHRLRVSSGNNGHDALSTSSRSGTNSYHSTPKTNTVVAVSVAAADASLFCVPLLLPSVTPSCPLPSFAPAGVTPPFSLVTLYFPPNSSLTPLTLVLTLSHSVALVPSAPSVSRRMTSTCDSCLGSRSLSCS